jgi:hypothetical protein
VASDTRGARCVRFTTRNRAQSQVGNPQATNLEDAPPLPWTDCVKQAHQRSDNHQQAKRDADQPKSTFDVRIGDIHGRLKRPNFAAQ